MRGSLPRRRRRLRPHALTWFGGGWRWRWLNGLSDNGPRLGLRLHRRRRLGGLSDNGSGLGLLHLRCRLILHGGRRGWGSHRRAHEGVHTTERTGDGLQSPGDRGVPHGLSLKLRQRALEIRKRRLCVRRGLGSARSFDLMEGAHGLSDGCG